MGIDSILFKILISDNVYIFEVFFQASSAGKAWKVAIDTKFVSIFFLHIRVTRYFVRYQDPPPLISRMVWLNYECAISYKIRKWILKMFWEIKFKQVYIFLNLLTIDA